MTPTIEFTKEQMVGTFLYSDGTYLVSGNTVANLEDGGLYSASGTVKKDDAFIGSFYANRQGADLKVNITDTEAKNIAEVSTVVAACIAKAAEHYQ